MKHHIKTKYCDELVSFKWGKYTSGQIALQLTGVEGPVMTVTSNMPDYDIPKGCIVVKDYSENEGIASELIRVGVIQKRPVDQIRSGFVSMGVHKLRINTETGERLKSYDCAPSHGVDKVAKIIMRRDELLYSEAREIVEDCVATLRAIASQDDISPFDALEEMTDELSGTLGLEPDYLDELILNQL